MNADVAARKFEKEKKWMPQAEAYRAHDAVLMPSYV